MVLGKVHRVNVKTGKRELVEEDITLPPTIQEEKGIDLKDIEKLINYAKSKGWI